MLVVHLLYVGWIWPEAEGIAQLAAETGGVLPRNLVIVLKDFEQELCLILLIWGTYLCVEKMLLISSQSYLFDIDLLKDIEEQEESIPEILKDIEELAPEIRETPVVQTLSMSLRRYLITQSIQNASEAVLSALEVLSVRNESELSLIKYIAWAVPSIGFLGTVRGIGQAMAEAETAIAGNIGPMTTSLGVAFNSTFVALLISIVLMLLLSFLQRMQDDTVVKVQSYCERYLINRISRQSNDETQTA